MTESIDQKAARLAQKVFQHLQGNMSATFGWQGNDPDGYTLALKAHNQKTIDLIAADLRTELSISAVQGEVVQQDQRKLNGLTLAVWACSKSLGSATPEQMRELLAQCVPYLRAATPQPAIAQPERKLHEASRDAAVDTLLNLGYTYRYGPMWEPASIGGEVTDAEIYTIWNAATHWPGADSGDIKKFARAVIAATSTKPVQTLQDAKNEGRLKFMASRPSRYVKCDRNALYRVYEDDAIELAEHVEWRPMTPAYYGTANAAIDAAIARQKETL